MVANITKKKDHNKKKIYVYFYVLEILYIISVLCDLLECSSMDILYCRPFCVSVYNMFTNCHYLFQLPKKKAKGISKKMKKMQEFEKRLQEKEFDRTFFREFWPDNV